MKRLRNLVITFICMILFPMSISALEVEYTLFDSVMTVNQDRTIDISENYNLYFIQDVNSITRKLSSNLVENRPDKSSIMINSIIENINSKGKFTTKTENKFTNVSIDIDGFRDEVGEASLSYRYNLGKDTAKNYDELYYDIVSNMDASISNLTFTINMPQDYDHSKVDFSIDGKYNLTSDDLEVFFEDNKITGTLNTLLEAGQTFSVRIELDEGYFIGASDNFNYFKFLFLIFPFISFIIVLVYFLKYGKGNKVVVEKLDSIPDSFDPAEVGYLFKGECEERDLIADLLYLANEGYLRIEENDDGYKLGKENSFQFVKLKDYEKNNAVQKILFEKLFSEGDIATLESIEYHFSETFSSAKQKLENADNYEKLFFKDISLKKVIALIFIVLSIITIHFVPFTGHYLYLIIAILLMSLSLYVLFISESTIILKMIFGILLFGGTAYFGIHSILLESKLLLIYGIGVFLILFTSFLYSKLPIRTKYGNRMLGKTYALKQYLETLAPHVLEKKLEENRNFFFEMIPYACVLGSLEKWISKGKGIIEAPPEWYIPSDEFNLRKFEKFIQNVLYTTAMVMMKKSYSQVGVDIEYSQDKVKTNLND